MGNLNIEVGPANYAKPPKPRRVGLAVVVSGTVVLLSLLGVYFNSHRSKPVSQGDASKVKAGVETPDTPEQVLRKYLATDTVEKRLAFVRDPQRVGPLMRKSYLPKIPIIPKFEIVETREYGAYKDFGQPYSVVVVRAPDEPQDLWYFVAKSAAGYKVDWESIAQPSMTLKRFVLDVPRTTHSFRVLCSITNYYNYRFRNSKKTHYSFSLRDKFGTQVYGYFSKNDPDAKKLADALVDSPEGSTLFAIVELQHTGPTNDPYEHEYLNITRLVSDSWIDWGVQ